MAISFVEGLFEVNCVCHGETEDAPYDLSICSDVELDDLDEYVDRCFFVFMGLMELAVNSDDPRWVPSDAAAFLFSLIEAAETGSEFNMLA